MKNSQKIGTLIIFFVPPISLENFQKLAIQGNKISRGRLPNDRYKSMYRITQKFYFLFNRNPSRTRVLDKKLKIKEHTKVGDGKFL